MKVAIPHWQGRVSPVFDVASHVLLVDVDAGMERRRQDTRLDVGVPRARASLLAGLGADVLVCGAISRQQETALSAAGVRVIPYICGDVEEVLLAFNNGQLGEDGFLMPGRCGWRRRCRCRRHRPVSQETGQGVEDHESSNKRKGAGAE